MTLLVRLDAPLPEDYSLAALLLEPARLLPHVPVLCEQANCISSLCALVSRVRTSIMWNEFDTSIDFSNGIFFPNC